ncbi:methanethiol S-methyltransferase [Hirschia baltica]|uniref:methanethiol S-methyltransferase n=1 Tax=Hirschia baltica (strain ATCC 49814 / DSM 5838 / IFAM 1418) TaxID=582402 RepID=C6XRI9_HIRBI|nr:methanethiol S-methyltransferase [Hirschia baltica]ACT58821.1 conserved hypothetical protein [Hirschia baltica ATCC 49814]
MRALVLIYGTICYTAFLLVFLYLIAFVGDYGDGNTLNKGPNSPIGIAFTINVILLFLFSIQHSAMARPTFKRWLAKLVPASIERSTYVLLTNLVLVLLYFQWRPIDGLVWQITNPAIIIILQSLFWIGWATVLCSTFMINHFELFGLRQIWQNWTRTTAAPPTFRTPFFYNLVRHPIYTGFLIAFWATPTMTAGHLLFASGMTLYIFIGIQFEERDLLRIFGEQYQKYRKQVAMVIPGLKL